MEMIIILLSFSVSLISVLGTGPGDRLLEISFANSYDQNLFMPASTESKIRCEKAWNDTDGHSLGKKDTYECAVSIENKAVTFRSSFSHADITDMLFVYCQINVASKRQGKAAGTSGDTVHQFWLSDVEENHYTYILKEDLDGTGRLNIIEIVNILDSGPGNYALEVDFLNTYIERHFKPATAEPKVRCRRAWEHINKGKLYYLQETNEWTGQRKTVKFTSRVLQDAANMTEMLFLLCYVGTDSFWLTEDVDENGLTYILENNFYKTLHIIDRANI